jgi:phosphoribosylaminoimidazole (AIR) synthetase
MAIVVAQGDADLALRALRAAGETAWRIGHIETRVPDGPQTIIV